jgi:hypothetical protein
MNKYLILIPVLLLVAGQALAEPNNPAISLEDVDSNGDGVMSPDESKRYLDNLAIEEQRKLNALKQEEARLRAEQNKPKPTVSFHPADTNQDGAVSPQEFAAYKAALLKNKTATPAQVIAPKPDDKGLTAYQKKKYGWREEEMNALDKNKDGVLSADELKGGTQTKFNAADKNGDGVLSPDETAASVEAFKAGKTKTDGDATAGQQANRLKNRLNNADFNDDKKISKEEYETFMSKQQQNFDLNADGVISRDEYRADGERLPAKYLRKPH